jgi:hypothetical protein
MAAAKTAVGAGKRASQNRVRVLLVNGEKKNIHPTWYHGSREGHGNYMTGYYDNNITVEDSTGRPIPFRQIGFLDYN